MQEVASELAGLDAATTYTNMDTSQLDDVRARSTRFVGEMRSTRDVRRPPFRRRPSPPLRLGDVHLPPGDESL